MRGTIIISLVLLLCACQKDPLIIEGNQAPYDGTVSNQAKKNYIQKVYLATLGVLPSDSEATSAFNLLSANNCSVNDRQQFLDMLFAKPTFKTNLYDRENDDLLDGITATEINYMISDLQAVLNNPGPGEDTISVRIELNRAINLRDARAKFSSGQITFKEVQRRMVESTFFYYANGYGDAWVFAIFDFFLLRAPTLDELDQVNYMVGNMPGILFLQNGVNMEDLLDIIFSNYSFSEGQVRKLYKKHLYREATVSELQTLVPQYKSTNDIKSVLNKILISDEYLNM